ncbi:MAG: hypothetical protein GTO24_26815 [candidate division Zixibacteria bacterium]|nr:hypothetical protein [candidate division Zixibacteria bacterium]
MVKRLGAEIPQSDPRQKLVYATSEPIEALQVSNCTFYRHVRKLHLTPYLKSGSNKRFNGYDQAMRLFHSIYVPVNPLKLAEFLAEWDRQRPRRRRDDATVL